MIEIKREKWADCIGELMPLCQQVFELKEAEFTGLTLDFDADLFASIEGEDAFHCLVMRENGQVIGFHWVFITPMLRHKGVYQAHTDAIFVCPEHRKYSHELLRYSEYYIQQRAGFWTLANLDVTDRYKMWQRKGFEAIETIMFKKMR